MRFAGVCFRAHDPRWAYKPLSGDGAALRGARFNPKGTPALYLALNLETAVLEANQGFGHKIDPCTLCSYEVDCDDVVDLRDDIGRQAVGVTLEDMACAWALCLAEGIEPPSWVIVRKLMAQKCSGALVPSFAVGARDTSQNLVLWRWGDTLPHRVTVNDVRGKLPKDQSSWI